MSAREGVAGRGSQFSRGLQAKRTALAVGPTLSTGLLHLVRSWTAPQVAPSPTKRPGPCERAGGESHIRRRSARAEPLPVFARAKERLHHFGLYVITAERVQLGQPEIESGGIRIPAEITEVFHRDEDPSELRLGEGGVLG